MCVCLCYSHAQGSDLELHKSVLGEVILSPEFCAIGHLKNVTCEALTFYKYECDRRKVIHSHVR